MFPIPESSGVNWESPIPLFITSRDVIERSPGTAWDGMGVGPKCAEGCFSPEYAGMRDAGLGRAAL